MQQDYTTQSDQFYKQQQFLVKETFKYSYYNQQLQRPVRTLLQGSELFLLAKTKKFVHRNTKKQKKIEQKLRVQYTHVSHCQLLWPLLSVPPGAVLRPVHLLTLL